MLPVVEIPGLTKEDADQRAADLGIDATTVEIIQQADGTFTVRATYGHSGLDGHGTGQ